MPNEDTIKLLKECNAGTKMAIESIDEVLDKTQNKELLSILQRSLKQHQLLESQTEEKLHEYHDSGKEPNPIAQTMAWMKTNIKLLTNPNDQEIAELMIDGCNMGIKSVSRYINQYPTAIKEAKELANKLVEIEQDFMDKLRLYL